MHANPLNPEQQLQAQQFADLFIQLAQREAHLFGQLLASRPDKQLLGQTEFDLRDLVHQLGAAFLTAVVNERKKGGTLGRAKSAPTAPPTPI